MQLLLPFLTTTDNFHERDALMGMPVHFVFPAARYNLLACDKELGQAEITSPSSATRVT